MCPTPTSKFASTQAWIKGIFIIFEELEASYDEYIVHYMFFRIAEEGKDMW